MAAEKAQRGMPGATVTPGSPVPSGPGMWVRGRGRPRPGFRLADLS